jgi:hypothetical protein
MEKKAEYPAYNFICNLPDDLLDHHPLAASLQTFETSLMLLSLGRIPAALVMCGSAIESVQKAKLQTEESEDIKAGALFKLVKGHYNKKREDWDELWTPYNNFFKARNSIIHYGYTPESADNCARQLLGAGYPILSNLYESLFNIHLIKRDETQKPLFYFPKLEKFWEDTNKIYKLATEKKEDYVAYALLPLIHYIRYLMHDDGDDGSNEYSLYQFEKTNRIKNILEKRYTYAREFECPICGMDTFVAGLSPEALEVNDVVAIEEGECALCDFGTNSKQKLVLDVIMEDELKKKSPAIRKDYGLR